MINLYTVVAIVFLLKLNNVSQQRECFLLWRELMDMTQCSVCMEHMQMYAPPDSPSESLDGDRALPETIEVFYT